MQICFFELVVPNQLRLTQFKMKMPRYLKKCNGGGAKTGSHSVSMVRFMSTYQLANGVTKCKCQLILKTALPGIVIIYCYVDVEKYVHEIWQLKSGSVLSKSA